MRTIREYQDVVDQWIHNYGVRYFDIMTNMAILTEEVGEVARIVSRGWGEQSFKESELPANLNEEEKAAYAKSKLAEELADLIWVATAIANQTGIELTTAIEKNIAKKTARDAERHHQNNKLRMK